MGRPKKIITNTTVSSNTTKIAESKETKETTEAKEKTQNIQTPEIENTTIVKSKRGRKPKSETLNKINNITCEISEIVNKNDNSEQKNEEINDEIIGENENDCPNNVTSSSKGDKTSLKKRGRKPKGGKIIQQILPPINVVETKPNIILHLKCSLKDLNNNVFSNTVNAFSFENKTDLTYDIISSNLNNNDFNNFQNKIPEQESNNFNSIFCKNNTFLNEEIQNEQMNENNYNYKENKENDIKEIWKKLKILENNLHINNISDKKSACFWCSYDFDTPCIYIPKHFIKDTYHVYGCFCSPECATAYLMEENIDTSSKFERYHLLNHIYSKIYDYKKNIKPAPNPFYILDKYYGNLNIQEYRSLLKSERLFLVVDKPLTRILPELHEDNDDFIINNKIIPSNTYQIKKKLVNKNLSKTNILNEKFGLTA
jgi:hypothetical protein